MINDKFIGHNGFLWFVGVVENRQDPEFAGRVRVRALGHHTSNQSILPTADLPWAQVVLPITSSGISGLGQTPLGLVEGSWVFGYFRDGNNKQEPLVLGSLPGKPSELSQAGGFYDPNGIYPKYKQEPDVNRLAVNNEDNPHLSLTLRQSTRLTGIATADFNAFVNADGSSVIASDGDTFDQPAIPYNAVYPYNHVYESESGHIREFDDTSGAERIHESHRTGTSYEIDKDGNKIEIIKGDSYELMSANKRIAIAGQSDITIDGRHKLFINKSNTTDNHYDIQIGAGASINIQVDSGDVNIHTVQGKINMNAGGDYNLKVGGNYTVEVAGNTTETIEGTKTSNTTGAVTHRGSTIDLNP
tara:strand:- start:557 stop:1633 length:1077 start_codon:yes stop_codon:yes gene_type:complete